MIVNFEDKSPRLAARVFVAPDALVLGQVSIGTESSIWYGTVIRGDVHHITIGERTNIQDHCVVHVSNDDHPTRIGDLVTIGHGAIVHGCSIGGQSLIGMGAIILDGVEVGEGSMIAAGSVLPPGRRYAAGSLVIGSPAQVKRELSSEERSAIVRSAEHYVELAARHAAAGLLRSQQL